LNPGRTSGVLSQTIPYGDHLGFVFGGSFQWLAFGPWPEGKKMRAEDWKRLTYGL